MDCEDEYLFHSNDLPTKMSSFFELKREEFNDIAFQVDGRTIYAHRIILCAAIPYFYTVFSDKHMLDLDGIMIPNVEPDALESLIEFAYTSRVKIDMENVKTLLSAACVLQVDDVRDACCRFLTDRLNLQNILSIREYSSKLNCTELTEKADFYIRENFEEISGASDFVHIPFELLFQLARRDDLKVKCEENFFQAVMKWVQHFPRERQAKLPYLLKSVRFPLVNPSCIKNCIQKEQLIRTSMESRDILEEAMCYHLAPEKRKEVCSFSTRPRSFTTNYCETEPIYMHHLRVKYSVQWLDILKKSWTISNYDLILGYEHTVVELNKTMYCFCPSLTCVNDLEGSKVSFAKAMRVPRIWTGSTSHGGKLYVVGGCLANFYGNPQSSVAECFEPITGEWTMLRPMNMDRSAPGVVASAKFIYVLGGRGLKSSVLNTTEKFDVLSGKWTTMPPMLIKRCGLSCAVLNGKIYVCGGQLEHARQTASAEVYDPTTNEWEYIPSLNTARVSCKLLSYGDKLYAVGGMNDGKLLDTVEIFKNNADKWEYEKPLKK